MKILLRTFCLSLLFTFSLIPQELIVMKGSDTMFPMAQRWAEKFMYKNKDVVIQVIGGGSGNGINSLINGSIDLCMSSREMTISEKEHLKTRYKSLGIEIKVAVDGLSIYLNKNNPVSVLSIEELRQIYLGKITNWKDLGGNDEQIVLYGRESGSGTYVYFKDNILKSKDYSLSMHNLLGTSMVAAAVENYTNAIGFGGIAYAKGVKFAAIKGKNDSKGYIPTLETMKNNQYPLSRNLYIYSQNRLKGKVKEFVDWILSEEGQRVVTESGYFPLVIK